MLKLSLFLTLFLIVAFTVTPKKHQDIIDKKIFPYEDSVFLRTCQQLEKIELPLIFDCKNFCCEYQPLTWNQQAVFAKYLPDGFRFVGILGTENYVAILGSYSADNVIPAIVTFDLTGKIINEKVFYTGYCGEANQDFQSYQYLSINENLIIDYKDSSILEKTEIINGETEISTSVEVKKEHYRINKFGVLVN